LWRATPVGSIIIGVVDPGVGSTRGVCWVEADGRHFIGPDNGLAYIVALHAQQCTWREVRWQPDYSSASFHGRDWFAPLAVQLAQSGSVPSEAGAVRVEPWLADTAEVIYLDSYGSAYTGIRAAQVAPTASLLWRGQSLPRVRTFSDVAQGAPLCYANSQGLLEIAVNCGSAQRELGLTLGDKLQLETQQWVGTL
jgi:S-adenosylmethionine hydrolase